MTLELIEANELSAAKTLLRKSNILRELCEDDPERYQLMEEYLEQPKQQLYTNEARRAHIAQRKHRLLII